MSAAPQVGWLPDGRRLHLNHGPIDLIVEAFGTEPARRQAYAHAQSRFETILAELVAELPPLRQSPNGTSPRVFAGSTARRMECAVMPFAGECFITPMAAVAGSVADEVLHAMLVEGGLERAYVNNGGDIALHLAPGQSMALAIAGTGHGLGDRIVIGHDQPVRGVATSGWRGRSHSLGIADAVTVLATTGAAADAAATVIANAVDLPGHPAISRYPARLLAPDSDLGDRLVTTGVGPLAAADIETALASGLQAARTCIARGLITGAALYLGGERRLAGAPPVARVSAPSIRGRQADAQQYGRAEPTIVANRRILEDHHA